MTTDSERSGGAAANARALPSETDLIVLGSGAPGLTAAITGAILGLRVLVIEKAARVGGTSARSAGSVWVPNTRHAPPGGDDPGNARRYLQAVLGDAYEPAGIDAFLDAGPEMIAFLEDRAGVPFRAYAHHPDYLADAEGATLSGRVLEVPPFDARVLGARFAELAWPLPEFTVFGGMMVDRTDIGHLLSATRSLRSSAHAFRLLARHLRDRVGHARGTRLVMGNALVGRLFDAALRHGVRFALSTHVDSLSVDGGRVTGVRLRRAGRVAATPRDLPRGDGASGSHDLRQRHGAAQAHDACQGAGTAEMHDRCESGACDREATSGLEAEARCGHAPDAPGADRPGDLVSIAARAGVVLATGGFSRDPTLRARLLPAQLGEHSALVESVTADGLHLAEPLGASLRTHRTNTFWAPVSMRPRADGSMAVFPHFVLDRGKPGVLAVDPAGRRFVNEAWPYHLFGQAICKALADHGGGLCHLLCDDPFIERYGLGTVRPRRIGLRAAQREGYVITADSLDALATRLNLPPSTLRDTIDRFNELARAGVDADFGKGGNAYQRNLGDASRGPNPCLGPIETPPFHALVIHAGDIGASAGLACDAQARVLAADGSPVAGLYACGNDMASVMAGHYPGPGITLGPGMSFAYIAAKDAFSRVEPRCLAGVSSA
ncbi:MAG: FAD-dependent oxidoreductase [Burkholderiaceae bacterium]